MRTGLGVRRGSGHTDAPANAVRRLSHGLQRDYPPSHRLAIRLACDAPLTGAGPAFRVARCGGRRYRDVPGSWRVRLRTIDMVLDTPGR